MEQRYDDRGSYRVAFVTVGVDRCEFEDERIVLGDILIQIPGIRQGIIKFALVDTGKIRNGSNDGISTGRIAGRFLILTDAYRGKSARWKARAGSELEFYIQTAPGIDDRINGF